MEREIVRNLSVNVCPDGSLILESLVVQLKSKGYFFDGAAIAYYSQRYEIYICCATDPVPKFSVIPVEEYEGLQSPLIIRAKLAPLAKESANNRNNDAPEVKEGKRPKERKISFVINKVLEWRKLYSGMIDDNGQIIKYSLEEAAEKVGVSKKSLDDYMLQLRLGKKYGFDFQQNKDNKVGILRAFIKKKREEENSVAGSNDDNQQQESDSEGDDESGEKVAIAKRKTKQGRKKGKGKKQ